MPYITRSLYELAPNTSSSSNIRSQSLWFSRVRNEFTRAYGGTVRPPTRTEFMREWNFIPEEYEIRCSGNNLEEYKESLKHFHLPYFHIPLQGRESTRYNKIKAATWVRMILAFNMYADVRNLLMLSPDNRIDFIGSSGHDRNSLSIRFSGCYVLHLLNDILHHMIYLITEGRNADFWELIFDIYDNHRTRHNSFRHEQYDNIINVDSPTHAIAQEYLNRTDDNELEIIPNNQQIADIIMQIKSSIPHNIRKIIYEACKTE